MLNASDATSPTDFVPIDTSRELESTPADGRKVKSYVSTPGALNIQREYSTVGKTPHPRVLFAMHKYLWALGDRERAIEEVSGLIASFPKSFESDKTYCTLKVECLLRRAEWIRILHENGLTDSILSDIISTVKEARDLASDQYSVWHAWAVTNYDQLRLADNKDNTADVVPATPTACAKDDLDIPVSPSRSAVRLGSTRIKRPVSFTNLLSITEVDIVTCYVVEAIKGFIRSIVLGKDQPVANVLQDTLRLLTLWFSYGTKKGVYQILDSELETISAEVWLSVTPQLIARMQMRPSEISLLLRKILSKVASAHPQALVCPISVALNTGDGHQSKVAEHVINVIRQSNEKLVHEATVVSMELLKVAISPHELWQVGLERAAHVYITSKDVESTLNVFASLHGAMGDELSLRASSSSSKRDVEAASVIGRTTLRDISFRCDYGRDLHIAYEWLQRYLQTELLSDFHQAWELYYSVTKRISVQLKTLRSIELSHVSPKLTESKSLLLAVPGTYRPGRDVVRIASFSSSVEVITSKQRPRKMTILGSDGVEYRFLLKGHEDLRQDERVMQLFGLINACLENNRNTRKRGYKIVRYTVLPLSNNSGLIGWVDNCDTLNQLIVKYREDRGYRTDTEYRLIQQMSNKEYDKLTAMQKVEIFLHVRQETSGRELATMLWLNSKTSEVWVERRANFTRSLAVTSMVGHILGLGDRHPSNLMIDRQSGRVVHIDFGDCFEVAMQRSKYPETVPFRLTRMLVLCMEASGLEGSYRATSETVCHIILLNNKLIFI